MLVWIVPYANYCRDEGNPTYEKQNEKAKNDPITNVKFSGDETQHHFLKQLL